MLETDTALPWAGHTSRYAAPDILQAISAHRLSLLFVNTRSQAELLFQELWRLNQDNLPIALHHGSLDATRRRKVEAAMAAGALRAVVSTSTLDLGVDWGEVDLVIKSGHQRERAGCSSVSVGPIIASKRHRGRCWCRPITSRSLNVAPQSRPPKRECTMPRRIGPVRWTCWPNTCGAWPAAARLDPAASIAKCAAPNPMQVSTRQNFDRVLDFVATGGYALRAYERYARLRRIGARTDSASPTQGWRNNTA